MLSQFSHSDIDPNLLVGIETADDAGVYRLSDEIALVQTVDFFTPIVDDPYTFGQVGAANALSDIYAMGADPLTCMNMVGFPIGQIDPQILNDILKGGFAKIKEAGASLVGGHSLNDQEPKYGLAATGILHPEKIWTNAGAAPGHRIILTKPLGTGIISTAVKAEKADAAHETKTIEAMTGLNKSAKKALENVHVTACTDVTGFGLLGHALEVARASQVQLEFWKDAVPLLPGTKAYAEAGLVPGGSRKNLTFVTEHCDFGQNVTEEEKLILADATTSGGLLAFVPEAQVEMAENLLKDAGCMAWWQIGQVRNHSGEAPVIHVE